MCGLLRPVYPDGPALDGGLWVSKLDALDFGVLRLEVLRLRVVEAVRDVRGVQRLLHDRTGRNRPVRRLVLLGVLLFDVVLE